MYYWLLHNCTKYHLSLLIIQCLVLITEHVLLTEFLKAGDAGTHVTGPYNYYKHTTGHCRQRAHKASLGDNFPDWRVVCVFLSVGLFHLKKKKNSSLYVLSFSADSNIRELILWKNLSLNTGKVVCWSICLSVGLSFCLYFGLSLCLFGWWNIRMSK